MIIIFVIIALTAIISISAFQNGELFDRLKFNAYFIKHSKEGYRFFSYALLHADWMHLIINMFVFWSFGDLVWNFFIYYFGTKAYLYFILLYAGGVLFSVVFDFARNKDNVYYNAVGASGAVSAVLFSSIFLHPTGTIYMFFVPIPIPSILFGVAYLFYSAYMAKRGRDNIGHSAHFWGAVYGIIFTIAIRPAFVPEFFEKIMSYFN